MAQATDLIIANDTFPNVRADINSVLSALGTLSAGSTQPNSVAYQLWLDTSTTPNTLKIRNASSNGWISIGTINQSSNVFAPSLTTVSVSAGSAGAPSLSFAADSNTGIYNPEANQLGFVTNGVLRGYWSADGEFVISTGGTPAVELIDSGSTGNAQTGTVKYIDSLGTSRAEVGYLGTGSTTFSISNGYTASAFAIRIAGTDVWTITPSLATFTQDISGTGISLSGNLTAVNVTSSGTAALATVTASGNVTVSGTMTASGATIMQGPKSGTVTTVGGTSVNCSTGNYFKKTISANTTFTFASVPSNVYSFIFTITATGSRTATFPTSVLWPSGTDPAQTADGTDMYVCVHHR